MQLIFDTFRSIAKGIWQNITRAMHWYRRGSIWRKVLVAGALIALLFVLFSSPEDGAEDNALSSGRFVTLAPVKDLAGVETASTIVGTVRAATGADVLAKTGGTLTSVNTKIGATVSSGAVIASIENASERAAVLSAEGAYEAALAARSSRSLSDTERAARDAYQSAYTELDTILEDDLGLFFGEPTTMGPKFLLDGASYDESSQFSRERKEIEDDVTRFKANHETASTQDPETLIDEAEALGRQIQAFLNLLSELVYETDSLATPAQTEALNSARSGINALLAQTTAARAGLRADTVGTTAGADAAVKQALGALRAAEANLEQTIVRAPIGGRVDFLPIRVGDYVAPLQHVATLSQSGALEVVAYVPENERELLTIGSTVMIDDTIPGVVTTVSPALDPVTKQTEVRIAVDGGASLIGGQSVRLSIQGAATSTDQVASGPLMLPLASVKLRAGDRIVFSVENDRLVAHSVTVGDVRGDRIEILSELSPELHIVTDARGLAEGELVRLMNSDS